MKLKKVYLAVIVAVFVAGITCSAIAEENNKIDLKLKLQTGQKFKTTITTEQQMQQNIQGRAMDVNTVQTMEMFSEVLEIDSNNIAKIKMTYGDMKMKMVSPQQGSFEYDSANPDPNATAGNPQLELMQSMWTSLKGISITMNVDSQGKAKGYEGFEEMLDAMTAKMTEKDPNAGAMTKELLKNFCNEDSMENTNNGMYGYFPDGPVAVGDMWDSITSLGANNFPIDIDVTCILKDVNDGIATIDTMAKIDMGTGEGKVIEQNGMKMNMLMTGVMNGYNKIDTKTGWLIESEVKHSMNGSMKMDPMPQMPEGMTIPMKIEGTTKVKSEPII